LGYWPRQPHRAEVLLSDEALRALFAVTSLVSPDPEFVAGTPKPPESAEWTAFRIQQVLRLPDDRVAAFVDSHSSRSEVALVVVFVRLGDRYLIDALIALAYGTATPMPEPASPPST
jgi:hypothetical protein